ncbi:hypothetical protein SCLCIDRAFT_112433, partial [Scleroderma citrinum Foug A]
IDLIRLAESLGAMQSGTKEDEEIKVLHRHPSSLNGLINRPTIILGEGNTIALWYLPGVLASCIQVQVCCVIIFHL